MIKSVNGMAVIGAKIVKALSPQTPYLAGAERDGSNVNAYGVCDYAPPSMENGNDNNGKSAFKGGR